MQRLEQYCEALEELGGINAACDSALSILRHAQRHGEDLRVSDLIVGCPVRKPVPVCHPAGSSVGGEETSADLNLIYFVQSLGIKISF